MIYMKQIKLSTRAGLSNNEGSVELIMMTTRMCSFVKWVKKALVFMLFSIFHLLFSTEIIFHFIEAMANRTEASV